MGEQRPKFGTRKWDIQISAYFSILKTEYSGQLFDVTLSCGNGTSKKKNQKIAMKMKKDQIRTRNSHVLEGSFSFRQYSCSACSGVLYCRVE